MHARTKMAALVGAAALALAGCAAPAPGGEGSTGAPGNLAEGKSFIRAIPSDPGTLDPTKTTASVARSIDRFLYARLADADLDGNLTTGLAEKWEGDTTTATFTLRENLTCEDGTPLTAKDVAANISFIGDPANAAPLLGLQVQPGTVAVGDDATRTVTVTSGVPDSFLVQNIASIGIVCGTALGKDDVLAKGGGATGMFKMGEIIANSSYTLVRRDEYTWGPEGWDPKQPGLPKEVVFKVVPNETTAANMLISGEANAVSVLGPDAQRLRDAGFVQSDLVGPIGYFTFNQREDVPTNDLKVRTALLQSLNLPELRNVIASGNGVEPPSLVQVGPNPCRGNYVAQNTPAFDEKAAAAALDAAGWKAGSDGTRTKDGAKLALTLMYPTTAGDAVTATAELVQATWTKLGIAVTLKGVDSPGLSETWFKTGDWTVSMAPITVNLPSMLVPFFSGPEAPEGMNFAHLRVAEYTDGVAAGAKKPGTEGCDDWNAAEAALVKTISVVPFANMPRGAFAGKSTFVEDDGINPTTIRMYE